MSIHNVNVSAAETGRIIDEALELRKKRQALLVRDREPDLRLVQPIPFFTYVFIFSVFKRLIIFKKIVETRKQITVIYLQQDIRILISCYMCLY